MSTFFDELPDSQLWADDVRRDDRFVRDHPYFYSRNNNGLVTICSLPDPKEQKRNHASIDGRITVHEFAIVPMHCAITRKRVGPPPTGYIWLVCRRRHATDALPFRAPPDCVWRFFIGFDDKYRDFILIPAHLFPGLSVHMYHYGATLFEAHRLPPSGQLSQSRPLLPVHVISDKMPVTFDIFDSSDVCPNENPRSTVSTKRKALEGNEDVDDKNNAGETCTTQTCTTDDSDGNCASNDSATTADSDAKSSEKSSAKPVHIPKTKKLIQRIQNIPCDVTLIPRGVWGQDTDLPSTDTSNGTSKRWSCRGQLMHEPGSGDRHSSLCDGSCKLLGHRVNSTTRRTTRVARSAGTASTFYLAMDVSDLPDPGRRVHHFTRFDWFIVLRSNIDNCFPSKKFYVLAIACDSRHYLVADATGKKVDPVTLFNLQGRRVKIDVRPLASSVHPRPLDERACDRDTDKSPILLVRLAALPRDYVKTHLIGVYCGEALPWTEQE